MSTVTTMQDTAPVARVADDDDAPSVAEQRILTDVRAGRIQMTVLGWQYDGKPASPEDTAILDRLNNWGWICTSWADPGSTFPVVIPNDPQVPSSRVRLLSLARRAQDQSLKDFTLELTQLVWWMDPSRLFPLFEDLVDHYGILYRRQNEGLNWAEEEEYGSDIHAAVDDAERDVDELLDKLVGPTPWGAQVERDEPVGSIW